MPAKGSTGTTRRAPLRSDRDVKLYAPTMAKPFFRVVAQGQVKRTSARARRSRRSLQIGTVKKGRAAWLEHQAESELALRGGEVTVVIGQ